MSHHHGTKNKTLLGCIYIRTGIDRDFQFVSLQELRNEKLWFQNQNVDGKKDWKFLMGASSKVSTTLAA